MTGGQVVALFLIGRVIAFGAVEVLRWVCN